MLCPRCKAEYRAGFTRCSECGVALVYRFLTEPDPDFEPQTELVVVRTYNNKFDVDLARTTLQAAGIESVIRSDDYGGGGPNLSFIGGIQLVVRSDEFADADLILNLDVR